MLHAWPLQAPHAHALITRLDVEPGVRGARRGPGADRRRRPRGQRRRGEARRAAVPRRGDVLRPRRLLGARRDPGRRPAGRRGDRGRVRAAAVAGHAARGDRGRELPGHARARSPRRRRRRACARRRTASPASSSSAARSTSTWRPTPRWPWSTRTARSSSSPAPSTRRRPRRSSPTCSGLSAHPVTVQCLRMGGGFGGKEMQPHGFAAIAALGATLTGRPVLLRLNRTQDITMTGKRHPFHATWEVGLRRRPADQRAAGHADQRRRLEPRPVRAGAGPGAVPHRQRLLDPEHRGARPDRQDQQDLPDRVPRLRRPAGHDRDRGHPRPLRAAAGRRAGGAAPAQLLRARPDHPVRAAGPARRAAGRHLGRSSPSAATSPAGKAEVAAFNREPPDTKRGLAITPVKFGISFNLTAFNQAGALVHVYKDGSVLINHGGTEMGQGLHTKMIQVAATALGVPLSYVRLAPTRTDKVPNTSATAASSGADLNGGAIKNACEQIRDRLNMVAAGKLGHPPRRRPVRRRHGHRHRLPRPADRVGRPGARRLLPAGAAVGGRLLPHRRAALGRRPDAGRAVQVLRLRRRRCPRSRSTASPARTGCCGPTSCTTSATACRR